MTEPPPELPGLRFERLLGSGGYADVYLYRQQLPNRLVAVKVLKDARLAESQRTQFTAEANAMAGLADHPNIVPVFSAEVSGDGRPYIVMMYYSRPNLAVRAASERLGVAEVLRIGIQIASAVETAHRAGILHRDIKPANLLISQYGAPGLADFGIAGQVAALEDDDDIGVSVPWSAPEVLFATSPTSVRSDVYSLAATLWHLLVGRSPFEIRSGDNTPFALMRRVRDTPPPSTGRADVPESLDRLLRQAMAKDPSVRVGTAIDFARGLQAVEQQLHLPRTEIVVTTDLVEPGDVATRRSELPRGAAPAAYPAPAYPPGGARPTVARPASYAPQRPVIPPVRPPVPSGPPVAGQPAAAPPAEALPTSPAHPIRAAHPIRPAARPEPAPALPPSVRGEPSGYPRADVPPTTSRPSRYAGQEPGPSYEPYAIPVARAGVTEPAAPETPPGNRTRYLLAGVAAVLVIGVIAGFVIFSGGSDGPKKPGPTISNGPSTQNAGVLGEDVPPGTPKVTGTRSKQGVLVFRWTYSAPQRGDTFRYRLVHGASGRVTTPTLTVAKPPAGVHCLQVQVVRADGSNAAAAYSPAGCAP